MYKRQAVLDLTQVCDLIGPLDDQIDLSGRLALFASPGIIFSVDSVYSESLFDLRDMRLAETLESEAVPNVLLRGVQGVAPIMVICCSFDTEVVMETGEEIHQLVYSVLRIDLLLSDTILTDEIAVLKILQHLAQMTAGLLAKFIADLIASQPLTI